MAMSATITTSPSTAVTEQPVTAILTISNSGSVPVGVTGVTGFARLTGSSVANYNSGVSVGVVNCLGPNVSLTVAGSSSLVVTFPLTFHAPSTGYLSSGSNTYDVSALCYSNDGSVFSPTAATVTVNYAVSFPTAQQ